MVLTIQVNLRKRNELVFIDNFQCLSDIIFYRTSPARRLFGDFPFC
jgi:hypothetical protein